MSKERERSVFGLHAIEFEATSGMTREEGRRMVALLRQRWSEISGAGDAAGSDDGPDVATRAILVGRLKLRGPVDITPLRHLPQEGLLVSAGGGPATLVGPAAEHILTELGERESFDVADAFAVLRDLGTIPRDRLVVQTMQSLADLMAAGVVAEVA